MAYSNKLPVYSVADPRQQAPICGTAFVSAPANTYSPAPANTYSPAPTNIYSPVPTTFHATGHTNQYQPMQQQVQPFQQHCNNITVVTQQPSFVPVVAIRRNPMPDDYLILSVLTCLFCNWICGFIAIIYSLQVSSAWESGDYEGARNNSRKARTWSVVSIISHVVFGVAAGVVFFIIIIAQ